MKLDEAEFHNQMDEQRQRARKAREALGDLGWAGVEFGKDVPETQFVGYDHTAIDDAKVVALVVENEQAEELMPGVEAIVVLDKTPSTPRWAARWPTTVSSPPTASPSRSPTCRRTRAASICTPAS